MRIVEKIPVAPGHEEAGSHPMNSSDAFVLVEDADVVPQGDASDKFKQAVNQIGCHDFSPFSPLTREVTD